MGIHIEDENKHCFIHGSFTGSYCHECHPETPDTLFLPPIFEKPPYVVKKPRKKRKTLAIKKGYGLKLPRKVKRNIMCQCMVNENDACNKRSKWEIKITANAASGAFGKQEFRFTSKYIKIYVCEEHKKELIK